MRESSIIKELLEKERALAIVFTLETRFGTVDDTLKNRILAIQDEELLTKLHRHSILAEKDVIEKEILAMSA